MSEKVNISTEYIPLGQFMKLINVLESGGMIKNYLQDVGVIVNGEIEHRRGRKLYPQDVIEIDNVGSYVVKLEKNE